MKSTTYYELEHPQYGIWYATSLLKAIEICGKNRNCYEYVFKKIDKPVNGWKITPIADIDDIPFKWIDASPEKIYKQN